MTREEYMQNLAVFYSGEDHNPYRLYNPQTKDLEKICPHINTPHVFKRMLRQARKHIVYVPTPPILAARCFHLMALHPSYLVEGSRREDQPYLQVVKVVKRTEGSVPLWEDRYVYEEHAWDYAARNWLNHLRNVSADAETALMRSYAKQLKVA